MRKLVFALVVLGATIPGAMASEVTLTTGQLDAVTASGRLGGGLGGGLLGGLLGNLPIGGLPGGGLPGGGLPGGLGGLLGGLLGGGLPGLPPS